jgi:hypothetical protein
MEPPRLEHPPLRIFWFIPKVFRAGIETHEVDGVQAVSNTETESGSTWRSRHCGATGNSMA